MFWGEGGGGQGGGTWAERQQAGMGGSSRSKPCHCCSKHTQTHTECLAVPPPRTHTTHHHTPPNTPPHQPCERRDGIQQQLRGALELAGGGQEDGLIHLELVLALPIPALGAQPPRLVQPRLDRAPVAAAQLQPAGSGGGRGVHGGYGVHGGWYMGWAGESKAGWLGSDSGSGRSVDTMSAHPSSHSIHHSVRSTRCAAPT